MWQCTVCDEAITDEFDVCWNCGTATDGTRDPEFAVSVSGVDSAVELEESLEDGGDEPESDEMPRPAGPMTRRELGELISKTLALILFAVATVLSVAAMFAFNVVLFSTAFGGPSGLEVTAFLFAIIPVAAIGAVGWFLWAKSEWVAAKMFRDDPSGIGFQPFSVQDAMAVAFSAAGLFFLFDGMRELVGLLFLAHEYSIDAFEIGVGAPFWSTIVKLGMAVTLILGSRGIVGAIRWCQTAGLSSGSDFESENDD